MSPSPCHRGRLSLAGWYRGRFWSFPASPCSFAFTSVSQQQRGHNIPAGVSLCSAGGLATDGPHRGSSGTIRATAVPSAQQWAWPVSLSVQARAPGAAVADAAAAAAADGAGAGTLAGGLVAHVAASPASPARPCPDYPLHAVRWGVWVWGRHSRVCITGVFGVWVEVDLSILPPHGCQWVWFCRACSFLVAGWVWWRGWWREGLEDRDMRWTNMDMD